MRVPHFLGVQAACHLIRHLIIPSPGEHTFYHLVTTNSLSFSGICRMNTLILESLLGQCPLTSLSTCCYVQEPGSTYATTASTQ